jgi:hypothetical protein
MGGIENLTIAKRSSLPRTNCGATNKLWRRTILITSHTMSVWRKASWTSMFNRLLWLVILITKILIVLDMLSYRQPRLQGIDPFNN